ncbi:Hypothetical protein SCLAV_p0272 (plasmid) [Streptomyces clavuligerus]|uniref:Uncharacterized protein n=1 Tax=Streptomyces clavuligerus TaxID=1901 RepID=D5SIM0_STRCL|nr:Hypothetical protein SCLAV_p0272 [Streptomyces clavuligerus]
MNRGPYGLGCSNCKPRDRTPFPQIRGRSALSGFTARLFTARLFRVGLFRVRWSPRVSGSRGGPILCRLW